jgi:hypothetical protein
MSADQQIPYLNKYLTMYLMKRWLLKIFQRILLKQQHQSLKMMCSTSLFLLIQKILWSWRRHLNPPNWNIRVY